MDVRNQRERHFICASSEKRTHARSQYQHRRELCGLREQETRVCSEQRSHRTNVLRSHRTTYVIVGSDGQQLMSRSR